MARSRGGGRHATWGTNEVAPPVPSSFTVCDAFGVNFFSIWCGVFARPGNLHTTSQTEACLCGCVCTFRMQFNGCRAGGMEMHILYAWKGIFCVCSYSCHTAEADKPE